MKTLHQYLIEDFKVTNNIITKKTSKIDILDKSVNSLDDIADILVEYFDLPKKPKIYDKVKTFRYNTYKFGQRVYKYFTIEVDERNKVQIGQINDKFLIQCLYKAKMITSYRFIGLKIHGNTFSNKLKVGDNFLEFVKKIKIVTDNHTSEDYDPKFVEIFKLDELEYN